MGRTMLKGAKLYEIFWKEVVHTVVYILNREFVRTHNKKTPYELWSGRPSLLKYFRIFSIKCYIKRNEDSLVKFDARIDEGILLDYSPHNKAHKCFNLILPKVVTSVDVIIDDESLTPSCTRIKQEYDGLEIEKSQVSENKEQIKET